MRTNTNSPKAYNCPLEKALRIMSFTPFDSHSLPYFQDCNIFKFCDVVNIEACNFINNCFNSNTSVFAERFKLVSESHARSSSKGYNNKGYNKGYNFCSKLEHFKIWKKISNLFCYSNKKPLSK